MNAQVKPKAVLLDLDALMDKKVSEIKDIADYINPPSGLYRLKIVDCQLEDFERKDENKKPTGEKGKRIKITREVVETYEIDNASGKEVAVPNGSRFTETFQGTEEGLEYFKKAAKTALQIDDLGDATIRDMISGIVDAEYDAKITLRKTKMPDGREYENINIRGISAPAEE